MLIGPLPLLVSPEVTAAAVIGALVNEDDNDDDNDNDDGTWKTKSR